MEYGLFPLPYPALPADKKRVLLSVSSFCRFYKEANDNPFK
jgi:hypothetical protein